MKLTVKQADLAKSLDHVAPVAIGLEVLKNVLLVAKSGRLSVTGGNENLFLSVDVGGEVQQDGSAAVSAGTLKNYVSNLPAGAVTLSGGEGGAVVVDSSGGGSATLSGRSASDYPARPQVVFGDVSLPMEDFQTLIDWVVFAAAGEDVQPPTIGGVHLAVNGGVVTLTATDRFRLARASFPLKDAAARAFSAIVRPKFLSIARKVFRRDDSVAIGVSEAGSWLGFQQQGAELLSLLVQGEYPDVARFIPGESTTEVLVDRQALIQVVQRVVALANPDTHSIRLHVEDSRIRLGVQSSGGDTAKDQIAATVKGGGVGICVNGRFLLDILNRVPGERAFLGITEPLKPVLIRPEGSALQNEWQLDFVLMPLRDNS